MLELRYELMEYAGPDAEAIYLRKPVQVSELKRRFPNLRGVVFEFDRTAFEPKQCNHQDYFVEVLKAFSLEAVTVRSSGRLSSLPDELWTASLRKLELSAYKNTFLIKPPSGFTNNLSSLIINAGEWIDSRVFDSPSLKEVQITNCKTPLEGLSYAKNLEKLVLRQVQLPLTHFNFKQLRILELGELLNVEYLPDCTDLRNLEVLKLSNLPQLRALPKGLNNQALLTFLTLYHIGHLQTEAIPFYVSNFPALENLQIYDCHFNYLKEPAGLADHSKADGSALAGVFSKVFKSNNPHSSSDQLPPIKNVYFQDEKMDHWPEALAINAAEQIQLTLPALVELPAFLGQCKQLKSLSLQVGNMSDFGQGWQVFSALEKATIQANGRVERVPDFGKENVALQQLSIKAVELAELPDSWAECPALHTLDIQAKFNELPIAWARFLALHTLRLKWTGFSIFIRKEMALPPNLSLTIECKNKERDQKLIQKLNVILTKTNATQQTRLVFGWLLLEDPDQAFPDDNEFKTNFLQAVNIGNSQLKQVIWSHLKRLNPGGVSFWELDNFSGKKLFITGTTRIKKSEYKEKLKGMGVELLNQITADVDFVLLGDTCADLPEGFWANSHWFCNEADLDKVLKEKQPGFMQALETNELDSLRKMIWSNDPANDRVVLEMLKKGGIPDEVMPDLVVVAKTSRDQAARNEFRNLLKTKVSDEFRAILSNTRDMDKIIERCKYSSAPVFKGLSQIIVCQYLRTKNKELLGVFFQFRESLENPYRSLLLQAIYPAFLERPHYINFPVVWLKTEELEQLLSEPVLQGKLKRLLIRCAGDTLPASLFRHTTLNELKISTDTERIPTEIGDLKRLQILEISGKHLRVVPESLLQIKTLKSYFLHSPLPLDQWDIPDEIRQEPTFNYRIAQRGQNY